MTKAFKNIIIKHFNKIFTPFVKYLDVHQEAIRCNTELKERITEKEKTLKAIEIKNNLYHSEILLLEKQVKEQTDQKGKEEKRNEYLLAQVKELTEQKEKEEKKIRKARKENKDLLQKIERSKNANRRNLRILMANLQDSDYLKAMNNIEEFRHKYIIEEVRSHTRADMETAISEKRVLLMGSPFENKIFFDRYGEKCAVAEVLDPRKQPWFLLKQRLASYDPSSTVVIIVWGESLLGYILVKSMSFDCCFIEELVDFELNKSIVASSWKDFSDIENVVLINPDTTTIEYKNEFNHNVLAVFSTNKNKIGKKWNSFNVEPLENIGRFDIHIGVIVFGFGWHKIVNELKLKGYSKIRSYSYERMRRIKQEDTVKDNINIEKINLVRQCLADDYSTLVLDGIIERRKTKNPDYTLLRTYPQYFEKDIICPYIHEVFVDVGAYDGSTITKFTEWNYGCFDYIYALEPSENNYKILSKKFANKKNITLLKLGAWSENATMSWKDDGERSTISEYHNASHKVRVQTLDSLIDRPVSFIKMDVEGAELEALKGAYNLIHKCRPKLAISVYHKKEDIWELPLWIHDVLPEHKLYIRHYGNTESETVLYAIPPRNV